MTVEFGPYEAAEYDATCRTPGCPNFGIRIRIWADANEPHILCGPCQVEIPQVVPKPAVDVHGTYLQDGTIAGQETPSE